MNLCPFYTKWIVLIDIWKGPFLQLWVIYL